MVRQPCMHDVITPEKVPGQRVRIAERLGLFCMAISARDQRRALIARASLALRRLKRKFSLTIFSPYL
jgi:hypothetical protein